MSVTLIPGPDGSAVPQYTELALDPSTWDMPDRFEFLTEADALVQRIKIRLRFFKGEWFLDQRLGVPYIEKILVKRPDRAIIDNLFVKLIATTPGIAKVTQFRSTLDAKTRTLSCDFVAVLKTGSTIIVQGEPFIL